MSEYVTDQMQYVDGSRVIRKSTWYDPATGASWDTFDDAGDAPEGSQSGSVVQAQDNPYGAQAAAGQPLFGVTAPPDLQQSSPFTQPTTYTAPSGNTKAPSGPYASTSTAAASAVSGAASGASGGSQVAPPNTNVFSPSGTVSPTDTNRARNQFLYNEDNPMGAFQNVLRGMGFRPELNNPLTNILSRAAPGLSAAYNISRANQGPGMTPSSDPGGDYGSFINQNLTSGGLFNTLQQGAGGLGSAIDQIKNQGQGAVNPYIQRLQQILESSGGQGLAGIMGSLQAPFMSPGVAGAYGQGLQGSVNRGIYDYGNSGQFSDPNSYWLQYLFNQAQQGGQPTP